MNNPTVTFYDQDGNEVIAPGRFEVCPRCAGKGTHDAWEGGMTREEMWEQGPDFEEDYMSGSYDVACSECNGERLITVIDEDRSPSDVVASYRQHLQDEADYRAERAAEIRAGC